MSTTVLFLSTQRLLRETFAAAFSHVPEIEFLRPVGSVSEAIQSLLARRLDVILVDVNPCLFGPRVAKELQAACPGCRILILASHIDPVAAQQLVLAGVVGVLSKEITIADLLWAIHQAVAGNSVAMRNDGAIVASDPWSDEISGLTDRETQVLELVAQGLANKQIAAELGISIKTVEKHRQNVMSKLHAHETAGLTWQAICMGVARRSSYAA